MKTTILLLQILYPDTIKYTLPTQLLPLNLHVSQAYWNRFSLQTLSSLVDNSSALNSSLVTASLNVSLTLKTAD